MKQYKQLSVLEREEISRGLAQGLKLREIAFKLSRSPSTLSRELSRNNSDKLNYRALEAQERAKILNHIPRRKRKLEQNKKLLKFLTKHLNKKWSPEQIAKELSLLYPDNMTMQISHTSIYAYLYVYPRGELKKQLIKQLRRKHKNRRPHKKRAKTCPIQDFIAIDQRPPEVNDRKIFGHWEGDLIMGAMNRSAIGTLVERITKKLLICKLKNKDAKTVREAFARKLSRFPEKTKKSLTYDQGQEMAQHKEFTKKTKITVYFADPHSPWQRGTSENTNGLIRDFFPKGTDFNKVSARELKKVENLINERPRKTLNWKKPKDLFNDLIALRTLN